MPDLPDEERRILGEVVYELRTRRRLTQEAVADRAGVSRKYIGDLEGGRRRASFDGVVLVTRALGTTLVEFAEEYERRASRVKVTP